MRENDFISIHRISTSQQEDHKEWNDRSDDAPAAETKSDMTALTLSLFVCIGYII